MDHYTEQPAVQRRLDFENMDIEDGTPHFVPGDREQRDSTLPRLRGDFEPCDTVSDAETDPESPPGMPTRDEMGGIRILYQGYGRPDVIRRPRPGMAAVIARDGDGLTTVYYLPLGQVQLALADPEETESEGGFEQDEIDD